MNDTNQPYLAERKTGEADVVSERLGFGGQTLRVPAHVREVIFEPSGKRVDARGGDVVLPTEEGRLLLRLPGFFRANVPLSLQ